MTRPRWILDFDPDFPGSALVHDRLAAQGAPEPIVVTRRDILMGNVPKLPDVCVGYGTMHTMTRLARTSTAVFDDYARLKCSSYYRRIYDMLGRTAVFVPFGALPSLDLARMFGPKVFVRSDTNYKLFPAQLLDVADVATWLDTYREHADELVVIAEPIPIAVEYRCFCRRGRFVCGSSYASSSPEGPYEPVPSDVQRFAERAATRMADDGMPMVTVDVAVGDAPNGYYRLVEIGGVNSWGVYGSNLDDFIAMMEAEALLLAEGA